jgi:hypothetical protein
LARRLRQLDVTLVHCPDVVAVLDAGLGARLARLSVIYHVRTVPEHLSLGSRRVLRRADHFVFASWHASERFGTAVPDDPAAVIHDGLDATRVDHATARKAIDRELGRPKRA